MTLSETAFKGLYVIEPKLFEDNRGYFFESWSQRSYANEGINFNFVQDNQSLSKRNVLRGLHFQAPPFAQAKLVRVIKGAVIDVALDLRVGSPTYGKHFSIELNEKNKIQFLVPEGFAHGFITLEDNTIFSYKCSQYYHKQSERTILWNDPDININWKIENPIVSEKDTQGLLLKEFNSPFTFL